jgi:hypothetical protein
MDTNEHEIVFGEQVGYAFAEIPARQTPGVV